MFRRQSLVLLLALLPGCTETPEPETPPGAWSQPPRATPPVPMQPSGAQPTEPEQGGTSYGPNSALRVLVSGPSTSKPQRGTGGTYKVKVSLTNDGQGPMTLGSTTMLFAVTREGVDFPCGRSTGAAGPASQPASLARGQTVRFERELPCALPIAGKYEVRAYLRFDQDPSSPPLATELVATLPVEVLPADVPNQYAYGPNPGLVVVVDAKPQTRPLTPEDAKKGLYSVFIDVTNTTKAVVDLKAPRVVFTATRNGQPVKCLPDMAKTTLVGPTLIEPGRTQRYTAPVQCDLTAEGQYELGGFVNFGHAGKGGDTSIGKLTLQVVTETK
jgi:hypothetical protein